jgi:hypothetical protein
MVAFSIVVDIGDSIMLTANFAIQPTSWAKFDSYGCSWATDMNHALQLAKLDDENYTVWRVPHVGEAYKWMDVK